MLHPFKPNIIVFPHPVPGNRLGDKTYDWNSCDGGAKPIGAFGLTTNSFIGGRVLILGYIKELGIWGCQDKHNMKNLLGFYMYDPETVTVLGKQLLEKRFEGKTIQYVNHSDIKLSKEESKALLERFSNVRQAAESIGVSEQVIVHADVGALEGLIEAKRFEAQRAGLLEKELGEDIPTAKESLSAEPLVANSATTENTKNAKSVPEINDTNKQKRTVKPVPQIKIATQT